MPHIAVLRSDLVALDALGRIAGTQPVPESVLEGRGEAGDLFVGACPSLCFLAPLKVLGNVDSLYCSWAFLLPCC